MKELKVAILGASGAVGQAMVDILEEREFPVAELRLLATEKSAGNLVKFRDEEIPIEKITAHSFKGIDLALFSAGSAASKKYAPKAVDNGAVVIDNSSAYRMDNHVPLIVPEVNPQEIKKHQGIIANPNCSTIQLVVILKPIYDKVGIKRLIISTYQAVSGTGRQAVTELREQTAAILKGSKIKRSVYPHQIAFNILPQIDVFEDNGFTKEEMKIIHETRKILDDERILITSTAVRVPVFIGHAESVYIETRRKIEIPKFNSLFVNRAGVKMVDDIGNEKYPLSIMAEMYDDVLIGRIRKDLAVDKGINFWIVANNLRKGAALNAVQIAELLYQK